MYRKALILVSPKVIKISNPLRQPRGFRQCRAPSWFVMIIMKLCMRLKDFSVLFLTFFKLISWPFRICVKHFISISHIWDIAITFCSFCLINHISIIGQSWKAKISSEQKIKQIVWTFISPCELAASAFYRVLHTL